MTQKPFNLYMQRLKSGALRPDIHQQKAVESLDKLYDQIIDCHPERKRRIPSHMLRFFTSFRMTQNKINGIYMHGGVGRGKSMMMDLFYESLPENLNKTRIHFHEFMIQTHDWLHQNRGNNVDNLLPNYAKHVAKNIRILCFDEFHVTDVADAMILARLFTALFEKGVVVIATSNWIPDRLYEGGLQRELFLPFIDLIKTRMEVIHINSSTDYRQEVIQDIDVYFSPLGRATSQKLDDLFAGLTDCAQPHSEELTVKGRIIKIDQAYQDIARFSFSELCEQPRAAEDYIAISQKYNTIFLEGIPKMGYDRRNEVKRLMTLIDVLYDNGNIVIFSADAKPDKIYYGHDYAFEFDRTISRLKEMQSSEYAKV